MRGTIGSAGDDEDVGDDEDQNPEDERAAGESEREVSLTRLAGVSLSGRRTTRLNKVIYGYLWEPGECSAFKRKPLSLIFGI